MSTTSTTPVSPNNIRKYLRAAPRPDTWDAYVRRVLPQLGATPAAQLAALQQATQHVRALHGRIEHKQGPGRKSNAEHAISFYEYIEVQLLERLRREEEEGGTTLNTNSEDHATTAAAAFSNTTKQAGQNITFNSKKKSGDHGSGASDTARIQHATKCDVCFARDPDATFRLCTTCPRAFHPRCSRPTVARVDEEWRCSFCILACEPKNTKPRRVAAAAVRLMARFRNQYKRRRVLGGEEFEDVGDEEVLEEEDSTGSLDKDEQAKVTDARAENNDDAQPEVEDARAEDEKDNTDDEVETSQRSFNKDNSNAGEGSLTTTEDDAMTTPERKRRTLALYKITDFLSPDPPDPNAGRARRHRKQPTLYDPQTVPAKKWRTDQPYPLNNKSDNEISGDEQKPAAKPGESIESNNNNAEDPTTTTPSNSNNHTEQQHNEDQNQLRQLRRRAKGDRADNIWCNFCMDDPAITICCFCACRTCFGKQHQGQVLLCDMCDDEYHMFCLDPPLATAPTEKWYCPTCEASLETRAARVTSRTRVSKGSWTTVNNSSSTDEQPPSPRRSSLDRSKKEPEVTSEEKKAQGRPRGRPRKHPVKKVPTVAAVSTYTGKKRGRPPKSTSLPPPQTKKRGRPFKSKSLTPPKSKRARNESNESVGMHSSGELSANTSKQGSQSPPLVGRSIPQTVASNDVPIPVQVSRSGRTVRRGNFHDEISPSANEQLLQQQPNRLRFISDGHRKAVEAAATAASSRAFAGPLGSGYQTAEQEASFLQSTESAILQPATVAYPVTAATMPLAFASAAPTLMDIPPTLNPLERTMGFPAEPMYAPTTSSASAIASRPSTFDDVMHNSKQPRRKPGARECMQMSRRFGAQVISDSNMEILLDYCRRGKVEHLIRMRERLDDHARFLEAQLAGLESLVREKGESDLRVPPGPSLEDHRHLL
jgi:hypothetical protein